MPAIDLLISRSPSGHPILESVLVTELGPMQYKLEHTPGMLLGLARGDEIRLLPEGGYELLRRGGNLAVQVYFRTLPEGELTHLAQRMGALPGTTFDAETPNLAAFSVPAQTGFTAVEEVMDEFIARNPQAEWVYGNVYGEDGVTPLNWWLDA
jgi:hypothetical protein